MTETSKLQEEADQDQETPKLDVTKESTENKKDTSELIECNERELGESNLDSLKPGYSKAKFKNLSKAKIIRNQSIRVVKIIGEIKKSIKLS